MNLRDKLHDFVQNKTSLQFTKGRGTLTEWSVDDDNVILHYELLEDDDDEVYIDNMSVDDFKAAYNVATTKTVDGTYNTIEDVRNLLLQIIPKLESGEMKAEVAKQINNTVNTIVNVTKLQMQHSKMLHEKSVEKNKFLES